VSEREGLCIVADGMGGRDFGEVASSLCVSTLHQAVRKHFPRTLAGRRLADAGPLVDVLVQTFDRWVRDANTAVYEFGSLDQRYSEMGTTLAMLYQQEDFAVLAHVGDSRIYRLENGSIELLTEDHTFVNTQLRAQLITRAEAERSHHRHILTRALGTRVTVKPDISVNPVRPGQVFLLCSDGLSDLVDAREMAEEVRRAGPDLSAAVEALIDLANSRGGTDNVTVVLARVEPPAEASPPASAA
jgi:PPM family protein phosphatase